MSIAWIVITSLLLIGLVLAARRVVSITQASAVELLDEEIGSLRARVHRMHDAIYAPPRRACCHSLQEALNEAKLRVNLLEQEFGGEAVPELPNLMIEAAKAIEYAETAAAANGIVLPAETPSTNGDMPPDTRTAA